MSEDSEKFLELFSTPMYRGQISEQIIDEAIKGVEDLQEKYVGDQPHSWDCDIWTTIEVEPQLHALPQFANLAQEIGQHAEKYCRAREAKVSVALSDLWANVQTNGQYQEAHHHKASMFSGCVYLMIPENERAGITFTTPRSHYFDNKLWGCDADREKQTFMAKRGNIIIFPSWLIHQTLPSQGKRISIAFNFVPHRG